MPDYRADGGSSRIMSSNHWIAVTESNYSWEREALEFIRQRLPQRDPIRAWANFEFIADDGSVNEVDLLVLTSMGIFIIEIKSRPGILRGDAGTWTWENEGRFFTDDNPLFAVDRKAKKLRSLLERQQATKKHKGRLPFIEPLVFLSAEHIQCNLTGNAHFKVCIQDREGATVQPGQPGMIMSALLNRECPGLDPNRRGISDVFVEKGAGTTWYYFTARYYLSLHHFATVCN